MNSQFNVSNRAFEMPESPIRKLVPYAEEAILRGTKIYHLNIGQPDIETPPEAMEKIKNFESKVLAYGHSAGLLEYRKSLSDYYKKFDIPLDENEILVTTGGSEAIIFAMTIVCDPGDEIIVFEPFYTNYNGFAIQASANLVPIRTLAEKGFAMPSKKEIVAKITDKTKALMICNPNNPTGYVLTKDEIEMLKDIALEHDLFIIADEVYREFVYDGEKHISILSIDGLEQNGIIVDSISKRYSACGARIGCICSKNKDVMTAALKLGQARLCPPTLEQYLGIAANDLPNTYMQSIIDEYKNRRDIIFSELEKIDGLFCLKPKGAFYLIAKLPVENADDFAKWLLTDFQDKNETVMFAPGNGFYNTKGLGKDEIRIAYILNKDDCKRAVELLGLGIEKYNSIKK